MSQRRLMGRVGRVVILAWALIVPASVSASAPSGGEQNIQPLIIGGTPADARWGTVVARLDIGGGLCSGTFISQEWILTAAHCIAPRATVYLGSTSVSSLQSVGEATGFAHPYYSYDTYQLIYDFGLYRLDTPTSIDPLLIPQVASYDDTDAWGTGTTVQAIGWGRTTPGGLGSSTLLSGTMQIVDKDDCADLDLSLGNVFDASTAICTFAPGVSPCNGDSGGPIVADDGGSFSIVGVTSYGPVDCDGHSVAAWTPSALSWIRSKTGLPLGSGSTLPPNGLEVTRVFGQDRYETAAAVGAFWRDPGVVFVATGAKFPDALAAGATASASGSPVPVLLVRPDEVPDSTRRLLERMMPSAIVLVGGTSAISVDVESELRSITGARIQRFGGADRYVTADLLTGLAWDGFRARRVWIASGRDFADPLIASTAAAVYGDAFVLIDGARPLPDYTRSRLGALGATSFSVVGSSLAFAASTLEELNTFGTVTTIFDTDVTTRSVKVWTDLAVSEWASLATVANFPDALSAVPFSALEPVSPLMLVSPTCVTSVVKAELSRLGVTRLAIFGGPAALSEQVEGLALCP